MKIKRERQVRLDELMKYVWDSNITRTRFEGKDCSIYVDSDGDIDVDEVKYISKDNLFTITEEVEVTEDTKLNVHEIYHYGNNDFNATTHFNISVNKVLNMGMKEPLFIYLQNEDGSIGELIWSKERGLVD